MHTIFDPKTREELIRRIHTLNDNNKALWGKMDVYQMIRHCVLNEEINLSRKHYKRLFIGRLFGKMAMKSMLKDDQHLKHNLPTHPELKIKGTGSVDAEKKRWVALIEQYGQLANGILVHPFFGRMTREQIGQMAYKHTDHHLRQFNA